MLPESQLCRLIPILRTTRAPPLSVCVCVPSRARGRLLVRIPEIHRFGGHCRNGRAGRRDCIISARRLFLWRAGGRGDRHVGGSGIRVMGRVLLVHVRSARNWVAIAMASLAIQLLNVPFVVALSSKTAHQENTRTRRAHARYLASCLLW